VKKHANCLFTHFQPVRLVVSLINTIGKSSSASDHSTLQPLETAWQLRGFFPATTARNKPLWSVQRYILVKGGKTPERREMTDSCQLTLNLPQRSNWPLANLTIFKRYQIASRSMTFHKMCIPYILRYLFLVFLLFLLFLVGLVLTTRTSGLWEESQFLFRYSSDFSGEF
jgi:hypothetical protein